MKCIRRPRGNQVHFYTATSPGFISSVAGYVPTVFLPLALVTKQPEVPFVLTLDRLLKTVFLFSLVTVSHSTRGDAAPPA